MNDRFDSPGKRPDRRASDRFASSNGRTRASSRRAAHDEAPPEGRYSRSRYESRSSDSAADNASRTVAARRKSRRRWKVALVAIALVAAVGLGAAFAAYQTVNGNLHLGIDQTLRDELVETDLAREPFYMLLLGTDGSIEREADASYGNTFRTDSIMLARIDPVNKKVSLVSIHRDSVVDLGRDYGKQKINAAHAFGGPALSVKAVSELAGVGISHYAEINFDGFKEIVDALGGVEVDVPVEINDDDAGGHLNAGLQTLSGEEALILCRSRNTYGTYADPDSMRAANQRLVLSAIAKKMLSADVGTIASTVTALSQYVKTDLEVADIVGLAQIMKGLDSSSDIYTAMEPVTSDYVDGGWYTYTVMDEWRAMIARMNQGLPPAESAVIDEATGTVVATTGEDAVASAMKMANVSVRNGCGVQGLGAEATALLNAAGFVNVTVGNASSFDYERTLVIYDDPAQKYEADLIVSTLGRGSAMLNDGNYLYDGEFLVIVGADWSTSSASASASSPSAAA